MKTELPPMLSRPISVGRRKLNKPLRGEGWSDNALSSHEPCPDCNGWISLNNDHDPYCPRLVYLTGDWRDRLVSERQE